MSDLFSVPHIAQLHEIQAARKKRGEPGIGPEVEALIRRLNDHGVIMLDGNRKAAREAQAKRYWDAGIAPALGYASLKDYLKDVPAAPDLGLSNQSMLHPWLLLIEPRIAFEDLCKAAKVDCRMSWVLRRNGDAPSGDKPFWIAFDDGRRRRGCAIDRFLEVTGSFDDHGFTAFIGVCAVLQKRGFVGEYSGDCHDPYYIHLAGSRSDTSPDEEGRVWYANLQTAPDGSVQIWENPSTQACAAYGIPSYVRH